MVAAYANLTFFKFFTMPSVPVDKPGFHCLASLNSLAEWITNSPLEQESLRHITLEELRSPFPALRILNLHGTDLDAITM